MNIKLPQKVKAGDKLSATWLNAIRDSLQTLDTLLTRRRLLPGTGYAVKESVGGSSLSINNQPEFLRLLNKNVFSNTDFTLRIKPEEQCEKDEQGNWDTILQAHKGDIRDAIGESIRVESMEKEEDEPEQPTSPDEGEEEKAWDAEDWVDISTVENEPIEVYVKFSQGKTTLPAKAEFSKEVKEDGSIYIPLGELSVDTINDEKVFYIHQWHIGTIELGGATTPMPFDAWVETVRHECEGIIETPAEEEEKYCIHVREGRVYLSDARYALIPEKETTLNAPNPVELKDGYLILEISQNGEGNLTYQYKIEEKIPCESVEVTEKENAN